VRSALTKVEGITDLKTDVPSRLCSFKVTDENLDIKAKLKELAKNNSHIKGYSIQ